MASYLDSQAEVKAEPVQCSNITGVPEGDKSNKYDCIIVYCQEDEAEAVDVRNNLLTIELNDENPPKIEIEEFVESSSFKRLEHLSKLKQKALFICVLFSKTISNSTLHEYHELLVDTTDAILPILLHPDYDIPAGFKSLNYICWTNKYKLEKFKNIIIEKRKTNNN